MEGRQQWYFYYSRSTVYYLFLMSRNLEVSFNSPQCGWMSIGFADGVGEFHTTTAHAPHAFALAELMQILTALLDTSAPQEEYLLKWNRDPEEFDLRFVRVGDEMVMQIFEYPTDERIHDDRKLVFEHRGKVTDICRAFAVTFDQLYYDRETDEFEFNWRQPFPLDAYEEFRSSSANLPLTR